MFGILLFECLLVSGLNALAIKNVSHRACLTFIYANLVWSFSASDEESENDREEAGNLTLSQEVTVSHEHFQFIVPCLI